MSTAEHDALRKALTKPEKLPTQEIVDILLAGAHKRLELPETATPGTRRRGTGNRLRNIVMIEALSSSAMRVGEVVRPERGHSLYKVHGAIVKYAKGKEREVFFSNRPWDSVQSYLKARGDGAQSRPLAGLPVFARHDRRAGSKVLPPFHRQCAKHSFRAGLPRRHPGAVPSDAPHSVPFLSHRVPQRDGDLALTHTSPTTTRAYAQTKREDCRRAPQHVFGSE